MLRQRTRNARSANHTHEFRAHNVGADLQRLVCRSCGHISINPLPPADLRSEVLNAKPSLFGNSELTVRLIEAIEPMLNRPRFGEKRSRR